MLREAVILAGGFGTRLSHVLGNVPKPMAPVYGKPFLCYMLDRLYDAGVTHVVLATGYLHEVIDHYFRNGYRGMTITCSVEDTPLFTGGAIVKAMQHISSGDFLVLNGDTLFDINLAQLCDFHTTHNAHLTIALRGVPDTSRYGAVTCEQNRIIAFHEKTDSLGAGTINGGIYCINHSWLMSQTLPEKFSFEKELMQPMAGQNGFYGVTSDGYFIDIGIPEDYHRAQQEFANLFPADEFLFLDRDGVLNRHILGDYVRNWSMWEWLPGVLPKMAELAQRYRRIFLVSNQQGVGKGQMSQADLDDIHRRMMADITAAGGRIDKIYTCTELESSNSPMRKPEIGMALQAQRDFPEVDFSRSVMVGDNVTDIFFARNAQMRAIYITKNNPVPDSVRDVTDLTVESLPALSL